MATIQSLGSQSSLTSGGPLNINGTQEDSVAVAALSCGAIVTGRGIVRFALYDKNNALVKEVILPLAKYGNVLNYGVTLNAAASSGLVSEDAGSLVYNCAAADFSQGRFEWEFGGRTSAESTIYPTVQTFS